MARLIVGLALLGFVWAWSADVGWAVAVMDSIIGIASAFAAVVGAWLSSMLLSGLQESVAG